MVKHLEHPLRDAKAADDIDHREDERNAAEDQGEVVAEVSPVGIDALHRLTDDDDGTDDGDAGECVHTRHQRRMEQTGDLPDDEVSDHCGHYEDQD